MLKTAPAPGNLGERSHANAKSERCKALEVLQHQPGSPVISQCASLPEWIPELVTLQGVPKGLDTDYDVQRKDIRC